MAFLRNQSAIVVHGVGHVFIPARDDILPSGPITGQFVEQADERFDGLLARP